MQHLDSEDLNSKQDCKDVKDKDSNIRPCQCWFEMLGVCRRPANIDCPQGVRWPQQEFVETEYVILG